MKTDTKTLREHLLMTNSGVPFSVDSKLSRIKNIVDACVDMESKLDVERVIIARATAFEHIRKILEEGEDS